MAQEFAAGRSRAHVINQGVKSGLSPRAARVWYAWNKFAHFLAKPQARRKKRKKRG